VGPDLRGSPLWASEGQEERGRNKGRGPRDCRNQLSPFGSIGHWGSYVRGAFGNHSKRRDRRHEIYLSRDASSEQVDHLGLGRGCVLHEIRAMALDHQGAVESKDLGDEAAPLVVVVDNENVDTDVQGQHLKMQVRYTADAFGPVVPQIFLAANISGTSEKLDRDGGGEDHIVAEVRENRLDIVW